MNEIDFKKWLDKQELGAKSRRDIVSRNKTVERNIPMCDLDKEYKKDKCESLLLLFVNNGDNEKMKKIGQNNFPIGKGSMASYKHAIRKYIQFMNEK